MSAEGKALCEPSEDRPMDCVRALSEHFFQNTEMWLWGSGGLA